MVLMLKSETTLSTGIDNTESLSGGGVRDPALKMTTLGKVLNSVLTASKSAGMASGFFRSALRERKPLVSWIPLPVLETTATLYPLLANFSATEEPTLGPAPRMRTTGLVDILVFW